VADFAAVTSGPLPIEPDFARGYVSGSRNCAVARLPGTGARHADAANGIGRVRPACVADGVVPGMKKERAAFCPETVCREE